MKKSNISNQSKAEALNVKRTRAQWRVLIDEWKSSGLSQSAFCDRRKLNYHNFVYHRKHYLQALNHRDRIVPMRVVSKKPSNPEMPFPFLLKLTSGATLSIPSFYDPEALKQLLAALKVC